MKPIKTKTYYNFLRVVRLIEKKGYCFEAAVVLTNQVFAQYESCPEGLSVLRLVEMIEPG